MATTYEQVEEWTNCSDDAYAAVCPPPTPFEKQLEKSVFASMSEYPFDMASDADCGWESMFDFTCGFNVSQRVDSGSNARQVLLNVTANPSTEATESTDTNQLVHTSNKRITFLAHGSYGRVPAALVAANIAWTTQVETNPVHFYYRTLYPYLIRSTRAAAAFVGASPSRVALVSNVENAFASVLNSLKHEWTDAHCLAAFDFTYGACRTALDRVCEERGCKLDIIQTTFPISRESILSDFTKYLHAHPERDSIKLAFFEHITSPTALVLPVKQLIQLCRANNILSLVDGAHAIGQVQLSLSDMQPDFYATNAHKWLCNPRGSALLYTHPKHKPKIHPLITTWGANKGFHSEFIWQGTDSYSPHLTLYTTIRFFERLTNGDPSSMYTRNANLAKKAGKILAHVWNTNLLTQDESMFASMVTVRVPARAPILTPSENKIDDCGTDTCQISDLHDDLISNFQVEVPVFTFRGKRYIRVSCHFYNSVHDVYTLARSVLLALGYREGVHDAFGRLDDVIANGGVVV
ncbi:pyridoxal phosphate-dependent transferase [Chytriomyces cf. hyalinus JEL632]|nr:pyridoxal phosphate-dependent transferase [Chytriomyces cf. hyalinus JEL632]